jgi:hypothetical protein
LNIDEINKDNWNPQQDYSNPLCVRHKFKPVTPDVMEAENCLCGRHRQLNLEKVTEDKLSSEKAHPEYAIFDVIKKALPHTTSNKCSGLEPPGENI